MSQGKKWEKKLANPRLWKSVLKVVCNKNVTPWRSGVKILIRKNQHNLVMKLVSMHASHTHGQAQLWNFTLSFRHRNRFFSLLVGGLIEVLKNRVTFWTVEFVIFHFSRKDYFSQRNVWRSLCNSRSDTRLEYKVVTLNSKTWHSATLGINLNKTFSYQGHIPRWNYHTILVN